MRVRVPPSALLNGPIFSRPFFFELKLKNRLKMDVIRKEVNAEIAELIVKVSPADYQNKVKTQLTKYQKSAKVPGFRPGKVPFGMIQKQYGKAILGEELNKLVNDALYSHIQENKLEILGNPIPKENTDVIGDFNNPLDFEFTYEIGYSPKIAIDLGSKSKYDYVKVKIDSTLIEKQLEDLRRRYGKLVSSQAVNEKDLILAQFVELNDDGTIKAGGILHSSTTSMEFVEDEATKKTLMNAKVGDKVEISANAITRGINDKAALLGIKVDELENHGDLYQMTINEIKRMELAELNQELYDKLFGEGTIKSEKELRERIATDLEGMFSNDSDRLLTRSVYKDLVENTNVQFPDNFLKRWIVLSNNKPITFDEVEKDYDLYKKDLKWQLIQGHIFKSNDIKVGQEDAIQFTKSLIVNQYAQYGMPGPDDASLTTQAQQALGNKEESGRIYDMLAEAKLSEFFKNTVKLNPKEVSYDEFVAMANK
jgi:trigger factor